MWQFSIDVGGTFTDSVAVAPDGSVHPHKVLSSGRVKTRLSPSGQSDLPNAPLFTGWTAETPDGQRAMLIGVTEDKRLIFDGPLPPGPVELFCDDIAPVIAIRHTLGLRVDEPIPPLHLKLGTTRGTNTLLQRNGAKVGLLITDGFGDTLLIGTQQRPDLFALDIVKPQPLTHAVAEVRERVAADGSVITPLDENDVRKALGALRDAGCETVAVAFVNSYRNEVHERRAGELARAAGFDVVTESAVLSNTIQFLPRVETAVLDAYLEPVLRSYLNNLQTALPGSEIQLMTSAGGLVSPQDFRGVASLLSGPAGGVVGCEHVARAAGVWDGNEATAGVIGFDMGGTSTDVCRIDRVHGIERVSDHVKADIRVAATTVAVETVAAGGGSVCDFDGVKLTVGPQSAGSDPGPACYGRGGPLTLTDVSVLLGRITPSEFPSPLDLDAANARVETLLDRVRASTTGDAITREELLNGWFDIAVENMARAVRRVTTAKGHDPAEDALITFGGAGGQYACAVAERLGCLTVLAHPFAGLLSAVGIGRAEQRREASRSVLTQLERFDGGVFNELETNARRQLPQADAVSYELDLRYHGTEASLSVVVSPTEPVQEIAQRFHSAHQTRFGYRRERSIEVVVARVIVLKSGADATAPIAPVMTQTVVAVGRPVILSDAFATTVVDPGWSARPLADGTLKLTRDETGTSSDLHNGAVASPVELELFHSRFAAIAEQMGVVLQNTSISTNVKERLDFSCAVFDGDGRLIVNAPHIPVHLGAIGETVRHLMTTQRFRDGDVFVTNDPYRGGSHLPDITVVTPVFVPIDAGEPANSEPTFFVASRAHHAEIGGIVPGSIPPHSTTLADEGVLIRDFRLIEGSDNVSDVPVDHTAALAALLSSEPYPSRNVADNLADITAQVAANQTGRQRLLALVEQCGLDAVVSSMAHIRAASAKKTRAALNTWSDQTQQSTFSATDRLDDGSPIALKITFADDFATFDFTGTGPVVPSNLNANRGIVTAAVLYTLRLLIGRVDKTAASLPLNDGVLEPVQLVLPECLLNPPVNDAPEQCAAVVGGNTETSQRVVDVLVQALGLAACSQGTMNNVTFGDDTFGYYETIAGGSGATTTADGADAVQVHMTNTRMTDVEVLEHRYPVRVRRFCIRRGSGGSGRQRGGDGVIREWEFLTLLSVSLVTGRRESAPRGLLAGGVGEKGRNRLFRADGTVEPWPWRHHDTVMPGDVLRMETPGGGGCG